MKKHAYNQLIASLSILTMLSGVGILFATAAGSGSKHLGSSNCANCHVAGAQVDADNANLLIANQEVLCGKCHPKAVQMSHPSGFKPRKKLPTTYPVDWKGDLTCSTCHIIHGTESGLMRGTTRGKPFCMSCHDAKFFEAMQDGGLSTLLGHLGKDNFDTRNLDAYSAECMACHEHNGSVKISATETPNEGILRHADGSSTHPIGTVYAESAKAGGYRPLNMLSKKILLPDGKLSCISCHVGYTKEHGKLITTNAGSSLCFECHDL